jgi:integrase/recombinase XerD
MIPDLATVDTSMQLIDQYSDYQRARGFSGHTIARRRTSVEGFRKFILPAELDMVGAEAVEEWLLTKPSMKTRHAYRSDLKVFYDWAIRRAGFTVNPVTDTDPIKMPKALPRPIGPEVHAALTVGPKRTRRMVALGLYAGLRAAEIAALDAGDVWTHQDPPLLVVRHGKGGKDRVIPMHPELVAMLADRPRSGPLFPGRYSGHVTASAVSALLSRHFRRLGIEATGHQLRHTFGTELARRMKGNLVATAAVMGHESTQTTMGYVGWSGESADVIAQMFTGDAA